MKNSARAYSILFVLVAWVFFSLSFASATPTKIISRDSLAANDLIDWSQLGVAVNFVQSGTFVTSNLGLTGSIWNFSTSVEHAFRRVDQGYGGWRGNFEDGAPLLFTNYSSGPLVIDFDTPVFGAGAQIQSHVGVSTSPGTPFTAYLKVYGANDTTVLATYSEEGISNNSADNSAIFLGVYDTVAEIGKIEYFINQKSSLEQSLSINNLSLTYDSNQYRGFDHQAYLAANPDLPQSWSKADCINHYKNFGFWEKRAVCFNLEEYLNANPDLPKNWSHAEALNHYNAFGRNENRLLAFDAQEYLSLYPDLPQDWSYEQAFSHYLYFGKQEGRIASFDEAAYLELYPDLPRSWDQADAFYHYLYYGKYEGRVYDPYDESVFQSN